jgi:hypothetical protein
MEEHGILLLLCVCVGLYPPMLLNPWKQFHYSGREEHAVGDHLKFKISNLLQLIILEPITVAARSKTWNIFSHSNTEIMGSNAARGMNAYLLLFNVCVVLFR